MPTRARHVPDDGSDLARRLRSIEDRLSRLTARTTPHTDPTPGAPLALALAGGWTPTGAPWAQPTARLISGTVMLSGVITPGTLTAGTVVATVPYRPAADMAVRVSTLTTASADLYILASGDITIQNTTGTVTAVSLDTIRYPAA